MLMVEYARGVEVVVEVLVLVRVVVADLMLARVRMPC